jgi:hypothetical protein
MLLFAVFEKKDYFCICKNGINITAYGKIFQHIGYLRPEAALYGGRYGKDEGI